MMRKRNNYWEKSKVNLIIDILMLVLMMPLAGIGFLMKYILVPGFKRSELYGNNVDLEFLSLDRHEWGQIHFIISAVLLFLLTLHIILHWKQIAGVFRRMIPNTFFRNLLAIMLGIGCLGMIVFPLFIQPEFVEHEPLYHNRDSHFPQLQAETDSLSVKQTSKGKFVVQEDQDGDFTRLTTPVITHLHKELPESYYEINGKQTLQFVADKFGVDVVKLAADLNIPVSLTGERLGQLKRQYPFTINDVRAAILKNKKE